MLAAAITLQLFEVIRRWVAEVDLGLRRINHQELQQSTLLDRAREFLGKLPTKDALRL